MIYNFNRTINRAGTNSVKFDFRKQYFGREDVIPMWVADMDFEVPPVVSEALINRAKHPIFGYSVIPDSYYDAVITWQTRRHDWNLKKDWILFSPGIVTGLNIIIQALTEPGDKIIVQPPVYFPFFSCVENNGRKLMLNQLLENNGSYSIDFDDLENKMKDGAKMLILCNPQNPVSRCWSKNELEWIAAKSIEHKILIVSDEIHCDLVFKPHRHIPMAALSEDIAQNTITCIAPSKTFNLAGLYSSSIIIPSDNLRNKFRTAEEKVHLSGNIFGIVAAETAYRYGDEWLDELMDYLKKNIIYVQDFLAANMPEVTFSPAEATYMLWLDFRKWGLPAADLKKMLIESAGLGFVDGTVFGPGGDGFERINIACPLKLLEESMFRLLSLRNSLI